MLYSRMGVGVSRSYKNRIFDVMIETIFFLANFPCQIFAHSECQRATCIRYFYTLTPFSKPNFFHLYRGERICMTSLTFQFYPASFHHGDFPPRGKLFGSFGWKLSSDRFWETLLCSFVSYFIQRRWLTVMGRIFFVVPIIIIIITLDYSWDYWISSLPNHRPHDGIEFLSSSSRHRSQPALA